MFYLMRNNTSCERFININLQARNGIKLKNNIGAIVIKMQLISLFAASVKSFFQPLTGLDTNGGPGNRGPQILARTTSSFTLGGPPGTLNL